MNGLLRKLCEKVSVALCFAPMKGLNIFIRQQNRNAEKNQDKVLFFEKKKQNKTKQNKTKQNKNKTLA